MARTDMLIIGSGIAGLSAALEAATYGQVYLLCKASADVTNTSMAQGGLAAVLEQPDSPARHIADTLAAGSKHNKPEAVALLAAQAPACIEALLALGVPFDRQANGSLALGLEGGHDHHRIVHAQDRTGWHIQHQLLEKVRQHPNIQLFEHHLVLDLLLETGEDGDRRCVGVEVLDLEHSYQRSFWAKATILASGGAGQLYQHTTNPAQATGDGLAIAQRAGVELADLEFVQFHPTTLYTPGEPVFLISEAVRGFGAELVLPGGERFMDRYHLQASLAPRDVVAQAMHQEMQQLQLPCLYLDLRHLSMADFAEKFPTISETLCQRGLDPGRDLVPVVPAAHYLCGGIKTGLHGETTISGLYACGECACTGLHGANRLASNSLPEGWIMGQRAARHARVHMQIDLPPAASLTREAFVLLTSGTHLPQLLRQQLQEAMWQYVGIVRSPAGLKKCLRLLGQLEAEIEDAHIQGVYSLEWIELQNLVQVATQLVAAALKRPQSCGCHKMLHDEKVLVYSAEIRTVKEYIK